MNNTKSRQLCDRMQQAYDRSFIVSSNLKAFLSAALGEFSKELATNPLPFLEKVRNEIAGIGKKNLVPLTDIRIIVLSELDVAIQLLTTHKQTIPALYYYIQECEDAKKQCPENSNTMIHLLESIFKRAIALLLCDRSADHSKLLAALVELDNEGKIRKYIFAPSLYAWHKEIHLLERNNASNIVKSCDRLIYLYSLYDLNLRQNMIQYFIQHNHHLAVHYICLDAEKLDAALESSTQKDAIVLGFDIEEIKVNMSRVWDFIKPLLLSSNKEIEASYDEKTGVLMIRGKSHPPFKKDNLPSKILGLLFPAGNPRFSALPFEDFYDNAIKAPADPEWYMLNAEEKRRINKKIYSACSTISRQIPNLVLLDNTCLKLNI